MHVPLIVRWPAEFAAQSGTQRDQFVSVSDITPTILDLLGIEAPSVFEGVEQLPVTGHSFADILRDADAPAANTLQYFENNGSRALITERNGEWWKAVTKHNQGDDFDTEPWELYNLTNDPSECDNLADTDVEIAQELIDLWWSEAERHGVLPLDDRMLELLLRCATIDRLTVQTVSMHIALRWPRYRQAPRRQPEAGGLISASVTFAEGDEGVLWSTGTENSGVSVFVQRGRLIVDYNAFNEHTLVESESEIPPGDVVCKCASNEPTEQQGGARSPSMGRRAGGTTFRLI